MIASRLLSRARGEGRSAMLRSSVSRTVPPRGWTTAAGTAIVTDTLVPHHLVFAGLALVSTWVILDVASHRVRLPHPEVTGHADGLGWPLWLRRALFAVVAVAAVVASVLVLRS